MINRGIIQMIGCVRCTKKANKSNRNNRFCICQINRLKNYEFIKICLSIMGPNFFWGPSFCEKYKSLGPKEKSDPAPISQMIHKMISQIFSWIDKQIFSLIDNQIFSLIDKQIMGPNFFGAQAFVLFTKAWAPKKHFVKSFCEIMGRFVKSFCESF